MFELAPTAALALGVAVPHATLGRETFDPGTAMYAASVGPSVSLDVGVLLARTVLPYIAFERAWLTCRYGDPCGTSTTDAAGLGLRVTSRGRFRVFGDFGFGVRRLTQPASGPYLARTYLDAEYFLENRRSAPDAPDDIRWTGSGELRAAVGGAYELRARVLLEAKLTLATGTFRHVRTGAWLPGPFDPLRERGLEADVPERAREPYYLIGLSIGIRGELPLR